MRRPIEVLSRAECEALLRHAGRGLTAGRNRAIVVLAWRAGLRCAEILALGLRDIGADGTVRIRRGKGDRARTVALDPASLAIVQGWIVERAKCCAIRRHTPLVCTLGGRRVQSSYVRAMLARLGRRASIEKRVHPHGLRHTFAAELAHEGVQLHVIQAALGHTNIATTSRYVSHVAAPEVVAALRGRQW